MSTFKLFWGRTCEALFLNFAGTRALTFPSTASTSTRVMVKETVGEGHNYSHVRKLKSTDAGTPISPGTAEHQNLSGPAQINRDPRLRSARIDPETLLETLPRKIHTIRRSTQGRTFHSLLRQKLVQPAAKSSELLLPAALRACSRRLAFSQLVSRFHLQFGLRLLFIMQSRKIKPRRSIMQVIYVDP